MGRLQLAAQQERMDYSAQRMPLWVVLQAQGLPWDAEEGMVPAA